MRDAKKEDKRRIEYKRIIRKITKVWGTREDNDRERLRGTNLMDMKRVKEMGKEHREVPRAKKENEQLHRKKQI